MDPHLVAGTNSVYTNQAFVVLYIFVTINAIGVLIMLYTIYQRISKGRIFIKTQFFKNIFKFKNLQKDKEFNLDKLTYSKMIFCQINGDKYE